MTTQTAQAIAEFQENAEVAFENKTRKSDSAFRTISEVADDLNVQQHVLRFWETKFSQVRPLKRGGGRRYYRPEDVTLLKKIHELLYTQGYTIKGVQKLLREVGKSQLLQDGRPQQGRVTPVVNGAAPVQVAAEQQDNTLNPRQASLLEAMLRELKELRSMVR